MAAQSGGLSGIIKSRPLRTAALEHRLLLRKMRARLVVTHPLNLLHQSILLLLWLHSPSMSQLLLMLLLPHIPSERRCAALVLLQWLLVLVLVLELVRVLVLAGEGRLEGCFNLCVWLNHRKGWLQPLGYHPLVWCECGGGPCGC